jgi:hypothetical protein
MGFLGEDVEALRGLSLGLPELTFSMSQPIEHPEYGPGVQRVHTEVALNPQDDTLFAGFWPGNPAADPEKD